jgi:hypothetical protein
MKNYITEIKNIRNYMCKAYHKKKIVEIIIMHIVIDLTTYNLNQ